MARSIPLGVRFRILSRDNFRCRYCGVTAGEARLCIDHVIPVSRGGSNEDRNLLTACFDCNSGKSDLVFEGVTKMPDVPLTVRDHHYDLWHALWGLSDVVYERMSGDTWRTQAQLIKTAWEIRNYTAGEIAVPPGEEAT